MERQWDQCVPSRVRGHLGMERGRKEDEEEREDSGGRANKTSEEHTYIVKQGQW